MRLLTEIRNLMGNYHVKSGVYHYYRNEYPQAVEFLRKALKDETNLTEADQRNARHYLTLSLIDYAGRLESRGELEPAVEQLNRAAEVSPDYPDIHYRRGRLLERLPRAAEAVTEYRRAIACHGGYLDAHVALGFCLLGMGAHDEAAQAFRQAEEVKKQKTEAPCRQGLELLERGDSPAARASFHQAFLAQPELALEHLRRGLEWLSAGEYEKSLIELDHALEHNPHYPDLHNLQGVVLCELDRIDEALESFRRASEQNPRYLVPRLNGAFALLRAGRYKDAESELESIVQADPGEPAATAQLEELRSGRLPERRRPVTRGNPR